VCKTYCTKSRLTFSCQHLEAVRRFKRFGDSSWKLFWRSI